MKRKCRKFYVTIKRANMVLHLQPGSATDCLSQYRALYIHTASVIIMNIQIIMVQAVSSAGTVGNVMIIGHLNFFIRCRYINL